MTTLGVATVFSHSYGDLPGYFAMSARPEPVSSPAIIRFNLPLAQSLGLDGEPFSGDMAAAVFSGNYLPPGVYPVAMAYAGHQFGGFSPVLGDGRAHLLGDVVDSRGRRFDVQLKGSGPTPFSRRGDGRAQLGPVLREYILSEFMHAVGVPTTRALAVVSTGDRVMRRQLAPGGIITRVAGGFVRFGTFEYFAARGQQQAVKELLDYVIARHYPALSQGEKPWLGLLEAVSGRLAHLVARWMGLGFIHGVMNTDNMSIIGETLDYGPCAFMDAYHPDTVYSSIDQEGRYAYSRQPGIAQWNLCRLAEALLSLVGEQGEADVEAATATINAFPARYEEEWLALFSAKLGLPPVAAARPLVVGWLEMLAQQRVDFTLAFHYLERAQKTRLAGLFTDTVALDAWLAQRAQLLRGHSLPVGAEVGSFGHPVVGPVNPLYIPRNHLVERVIRAAEDEGDFAPFHRLLEVLQRPYEEQPGAEAYTQPPRPEEVVQQTFCGT